MARRLSSAGLAHLKQFEGLSLIAYRDVGGVWTNGWGHTQGVRAGDRITLEQAEQFLVEDVRWAEDCVAKNIAVDVEQRQFDALVSIVFNIGCRAFEQSTLLWKLNSNDMLGASDEFLRWDKVKGKRVRGLTRRRESERRMFRDEVLA